MQYVLADAHNKDFLQTVSTYNVHPKVALEAYHAIRSGDNKKATECQWEMNKTINVLLTK